MAFDTKYRPNGYDSVIGQEANVKVLQSIVKNGSGFHQSYVFCGQHGTGKTTLGRILARALLCENPQEGNPCDQCSSCLSILENGSSEGFIEIDAATNSGKGDIKEIVDQLEYATVTGKKRIYLFDEAHELSRQALDGLLKPMEDTEVGSDDKKLVCIFCTTEPEKMRKTIFSRCAPAFVIRVPTPQDIADRLVYVCEKEEIEYDYEALVSISEYCSCHVRDSLKSLQGVSSLGKVDMAAIKQYLRLDVQIKCLEVLDNLRSDFAKAIENFDALRIIASPASCYEQLSKLSLMAYRKSLGVSKIPVYLDSKKIDSISKQGQQLIVLTQSLLSHPHNPSHEMLLCDLSNYHFGQAPIQTITKVVTQTLEPKTQPTQKNSQQIPQSSVSYQQQKPTIINGVYREARAVKKPPRKSESVPKKEGIPFEVFKDFLDARYQELEHEHGQKRRTNLGGFGTFSRRRV
jgi:DNA polymerase III subunit gamma/tau